MWKYSFFANSNPDDTTKAMATPNLQYDWDAGITTTSVDGITADDFPSLPRISAGSLINWSFD